MSEAATNYSESIKRLDQILEEIDKNQIPLDELATKVVEAAELLKKCKAVLTDTEDKVGAVLKDLEKDFGDDSTSPF